ncbi:MAG TPA: hypothetical protein VGV37_26890 [Aliidongia sp.]|uniref:hypothetical protein n=1 Tax=Aliidongia sp. TaxID=1914230 RepID=UPI002DDCD3B0|nr:hypothetical protein [Aliidongia sp.]HEV2678183.1 hypothetical protein [Aliidongia sp.]
MVDSLPHGTAPATAPHGRSGKRGQPIETGGIARILAAPDTSGYVRTWLGAALERDPMLAYQEAATLVGMLELLTCGEARAWLAPALAAALAQEPEAAFTASLEIAQALKPAAMVLQRMEQAMPEPANSRGVPSGPRGVEE